MIAGAGGAMRATGWRATAIRFHSVNQVRCPHARANNRETRRLLTNRPGSSFSAKSPIPTNVYASAIGLCKDSMIMQSRKPSNSDF